MFKVVPDYEFAMVNREGIIKSSHTGNTLTPYIDKDGYLRVKVWIPELKKLKGLFVHRAIAKAFIPNPDNKPCVNHKDSNRRNNDISNLEWCTEEENYRHGYKYGDILIGHFGENNCSNVHPETLIHSICSMLESGNSQAKIARDLGIKKSLVFDVKSKTTWKNVSDQYNIPDVKRNISEDTVHKICKYLQEGLDDKLIISKLGITKGILRFIKQRKTFKRISKDYNWD